MTRLSAIRASGLPEAFRCAGSARTPQVQIRPDLMEAGLGSAVHELLGQVVDQDLDSTVSLDVAGVAAKWRVDPDEAGRLTWYGVKAWRQLREFFLGAMSEIPLEASIAGVRLTGHPDLYAARAPRAAVLDWKSGRLDLDYREQIIGYCALVLLEHPDVEEVTGTIVWLRDQEIETYTLRRSELSAWTDRFRRILVEWDGTFRPGAHCTWCPRSHECPAMVALARRDVAILADAELADRIDRGLADLSPQEIVALERKAKAVIRYADRLRDAVRQKVMRDGPHDSGDGYELRMVTEPRREVQALEAWPILQTRLTDEELAGVVKVSVGKAEEAVAKKAPYRGGAAAKRELGAALESAGALQVVSIQKLKEVRKNR